MTRVVDLYIDHEIIKSEKRYVSESDNDKSDPISFKSFSINWYVDGKIKGYDKILTNSAGRSFIRNSYIRIIRKIMSQNQNSIINVITPEKNDYLDIYKSVSKKSFLTYVELNDENTIMEYIHLTSKIKANTLSYKTTHTANNLFPSEEISFSTIMKSARKDYYVATDASAVSYNDNNVSSAVCVSEEGQMYRELIKINDVNLAELKAISLAVEKFASRERNLIIFSDSLTAISKISSFNPDKSTCIEYDIIKPIYDAMNDGYCITIRKVKGHSNHHMNNAADAIAVASIARFRNQEKKKNRIPQKQTTASAIMSMMRSLHGKEFIANKKVVVHKNSATMIDIN